MMEEHITITPQAQAEDIFNDYMAILASPGKKQDEPADEFLIQAIASALAQCEQETRKRCRIETISDAKDRGYLDHADSCRKGIDSKTCTCGIMTWLVKEPKRHEAGGDKSSAGGAEGG